MMEISSLATRQSKIHRSVEQLVLLQSMFTQRVCTIDQLISGKTDDVSLAQITPSVYGEGPRAASDGNENTVSDPLDTAGKSGAGLSVTLASAIGDLLQPRLTQLKERQTDLRKRQAELDTMQKEILQRIAVLPQIEDMLG